MWSLVVALPAVQADFNAPRADATLPYTLTTIGFMTGGIIVGRLADRFGILPPLAGGTILMSLGYVLTASAPSLLVVAVVSAVTIGLGGAASFARLWCGEPSDLRLGAELYRRAADPAAGLGDAGHRTRA